MARWTLRREVGLLKGSVAALVLVSVFGCSSHHTNAVPPHAGSPTDAAATTATTKARSIVISPPSASPPTVALTCSASSLNPVPARPLFQVRGVGAGVSLWALVFNPHPFTVGTTVKIVWRMTGSGSLTVAATNLTTGRTTAPTDGPRQHGASSWHQPGDEWGTLWAFPTPGCWKLAATRTVGTGYVTVTVVEATTT